MCAWHSAYRDRSAGAAGAAGPSNLVVTDLPCPDANEPGCRSSSAVPHSAVQVTIRTFAGAYLPRPPLYIHASPHPCTHTNTHTLSTCATHTSAHRASHASDCASQGMRAVPSDITGQDMWTGYPCQSRAASMDCRSVPDAPECKGGSETAVPEGTTKYTRRCASGQPHRTRDQLSGCAPPAAPHAHTWSMRAPRTYQPHRPPQSDGDPSEDAPPPPPAPRPCEMMGEGEPEHVSRLVFGAEHGRASTEIT